PNKKPKLLPIIASPIFPPLSRGGNMSASKAGPTIQVAAAAVPCSSLIKVNAQKDWAKIKATVDKVSPTIPPTITFSLPHRSDITPRGMDSSRTADEYTANTSPVWREDSLITSTYKGNPGTMTPPMKLSTKMVRGTTNNALF